MVIKSLKRYRDFNELYSAYLDKTLIGYKPGEPGSPMDMLRYYKDDVIKRWGAFAIEIEAVK